MYLVLFYQHYPLDHSVIISEPMDFGSEKAFLDFCKKMNATKDVDNVYKYTNEIYKGEPPLYMKPIQVYPFVSDTDLESCIQFKY